MMFAVVLAVTMTVTETWEAPTADSVVVGPITHYSKNKMPKVLKTRGIITDVADYNGWLEANGYDGVTALEPKGDLGRVVWIMGRRLYVGDCRQRDHYPGAYRAEVDWGTAMKILAEGPWPDEVTIYFEPLPASRYPELVQ